MLMTSPAPIDTLIDRHPEYKEVLRQLDQLMKDAGLEPAIKWGIPVYGTHGQNVAGIGVFKSYFGIWFYQGVFLRDPDGVLIQGTSGSTKAQRQMRFQPSDTLDTARIAAYLAEAAELARQGVAHKPERSSELTLPETLVRALEEDAPLNAAFERLRPSQRREYAEYIAEARRADTRGRRLDKIRPLILAGAGLHDKYK